MTNRPWHVSVLIPARNEEQLLSRCLDSVLSAAEALRGYATTDVVIATDCCTDRTFQVAESMIGARGKVISVTAGTAGAARFLAAKEAIRRLKGPTHRVWLANTDADCVVPSRWLIDQLQLAHRGVAAFAGTVSVDSFEEHGPEVPSRFRSSYRINPDGTHPHVHGANFGVRADVYMEAGGWAPLATGEDHDLWGRLSDRCTRIASTSRIEVITNGRRIGRAPHGFAETLGAHNGVAA